MLFRRPFDVLLNQASVDGDRRRRSGACRGDYLSARIDHIARGPDTEGAGPAGGIDGDEASFIDLAAQAGKQAPGLRPEQEETPMPDTRRSAGSKRAANV